MITKNEPVLEDAPRLAMKLRQVLLHEWLVSFEAPAKSVPIKCSIQSFAS